MTRLELLRLVIGRARSNGFEFRHWYTARLNEPWINAETALQRLEQNRRYYSLLFSHEFASSFWKPGSDFTFQVEAQSFQRCRPDGTVATVSRKPFTRRSSRRDAWRFHLREMAAAEEPLRYIRRYLHVEEASGESPLPGASAAAAKGAAATFPAGPAAVGPAASSPAASVPKTAMRKPAARPLPEGLPAFLRRPYGGWPPDSGTSA